MSKSAAAAAAAAAAFFTVPALHRTLKAWSKNFSRNI
jgi:hypothetical protein